MKFRLVRTSSKRGTSPDVDDPRVSNKGKDWFIDINSLEQLMDFMKSIEFPRNSDQEFVLRPPTDDGEAAYLEIYDSYRE